MEKLLTVQQVADQLQVRPKTVREWLKSGQLKGVKIGGRQWRVKESDLQAFVDGQTGGGRKGKPRKKRK